MEKVEARSLEKSLIIAMLLAVAFSSFTLWLIESWIKYPLFLFEIVTIIVLYLIVSGYDVKLTMKHIKIGNLRVGLIIDVFLIVSALSLLILNASHIQGGLIQLVLALLSTSILVGYALLNIFGLARYFSRLETAVLSYILSYAFTSFITLASLSINEDTRTLIVLGSFIGLGLISALKHRRHKTAPLSRSLSKNIDSLALLLATAFYTLSFYLMYPGFTLLSGTDISRHYAHSIILGRTPDIYIGSVYLFAHLHESLFLSLSTPSLVSAQTALLTLNLMLPLAFYIMARPYLERIDARLPSLATLFWVLFTNSLGGFAWLHFANLKLSTTGQTQLQLLTTTADKTYNGTIYGILGSWYVPATIAFVVLMATIFLMCKKEISTSKYLALFSIMIAALYLTHVTEAVVFALFLAAYGAISRNENLRIDDSIKSSMIGFLGVILIYYIFSLLTARFIINLSLLISLAFPILALLLSLVFRRNIRPRLPSFRTKLRISSKTFTKTLVLSLLFAYCVAFLSWASVTESFYTWQVDTVGLVPWFMYPLMLGINGLLAILSLYYIIRNTKSHATLILFIAFMIFTFIAGKAVSTINLHFFDAGYSEKRFIWLIKLSLAILAPILVVFSVDMLRKKSIHVNIKTIVSVAIIGTIVLCGVSTTFLNLEYWNIVSNNPANKPSSNEMSAINALKEILDNDPKAWLATVTDTSAGMATFAAPADMLVLKQLLYTANRPEMAFTMLYRHPAYSHPYVYLHNRDLKYLNKFNDSFLAQYFNTLPLVFSNSEVRIYNVSKLSFPQPNSDNILIIPLDKSIEEQNIYMAYNLLSRGFYNYTIAYDIDNKAVNAGTIILSFDPTEENIIRGCLEYLHSGGRVVVLNTNGYGFFCDDLFSISNYTLTAERIAGENLKVDLPCEVSAPILISKNNQTTILSCYIASPYETPFISHQNYGIGELFYVNVHPIIKAMHENSNQSAFNGVLGKLFDDLNLTKMNPDTMLSFDGYVKEIYLSNDVKIETTSLLFPLKLELKQVNVEVGNYSYTFYNVTNIAISEYSRAIIEVDNAIIQNGNGFYTDFQINSTFSVKPLEDSMNLKITADGEDFNLRTVSLVLITPSNTIQLLTRTPTVSTSEVTFVEFYPQGFLQWWTRTYGQNLKVTGLTEFSLILSDSYSAIDDVKLSISFQRDPPIVTLDVLSTLPTAIFWSLLLLPVFMSIFFIFTFRESHRNNQTIDKKSNKKQAKLP